MPKYSINPNVRIIRDAPKNRTPKNPAPKDNELSRKFKDAMALFRMRTELLSRLDHKTTPEEASSISVMLEALIEAKRRLQK
ncbi:MAG TPA: hypothetical protein PK950_02865 [Candidatus Paceibacterota bacterium]|nr:hypothetical protein [Candidatus Paceibacterota bacterium]